MFAAIEKCIGLEFLEIIESFIMTQEPFEDIFKSSLKKINYLWLLITADRFQSSKIFLITFLDTYDAQSLKTFTTYLKFVELILNNIHDMNAFLPSNLEIISTTEICYLKEFVICFKLFDASLKQIEKKKIYFGHLVPLVVHLKKKLISLSSKELFYMKVSIKKTIDLVDRKFKKFLNFNQNEKAFLAACINPKFKLN